MIKFENFRKMHFYRALYEILNYETINVLIKIFAAVWDARNITYQILRRVHFN